MPPRIIYAPSGPVEVFKGVFVTLNWEGEPAVDERHIYVNNATKPSVILRRPVRLQRRRRRRR